MTFTDIPWSTNMEAETHRCLDNVVLSLKCIIWPGLVSTKLFDDDDDDRHECSHQIICKITTDSMYPSFRFTTKNVYWSEILNKSLIRNSSDCNFSERPSLKSRHFRNHRIYANSESTGCDLELLWGCGILGYKKKPCRMAF